MSSHLFVEPPSPLTSLPASSPWPTPCRSFKKNGLRLFKQNESDFAVELTENQHKFIQSGHWHLSQARKDSSYYRGRNTLDESRVKFQKDSPPDARLKMLENAGYELVPFKNDNRLTFIADRGGTVIGCLIPSCLTPERIKNISQRLQGLEKVSKKVAGFPRGAFSIVRHGIQMGSGSKVPSPCLQDAIEKQASKEFFHNRDVAQHLKHVGYVFRLHFPKLHRYYWSTLGMASTLVFDGSPPCNQLPFACFTLNVGRQCICGAHVDSQNLACGLCLVSPFGTFDHKKGGHLILHELKLVLEVPPGAAILFPSAIITHENIPIAADETRHSITAFTSGSLFRWVDNGFLRLNENHSRGSVKRKYFLNVVYGKVTPKEAINVWKSMTTRLPHIISLF